ncbi:hypothetical protein FACS1894159_04240 [Bacteroidia bacterium]|nr:hypothetical protein FACS1894159_04240 [Bacteroidia bacterium]
MEMKRIFLFVTVALVSFTAAAQKTTSGKPVYDYSAYEKKEIGKDGVTMPYRILMPENMKRGAKYPLFLVMHGMGLRGTDNARQLARGAHLFVEPENRVKYPCIALYPQTPQTSAFVESADKQASAQRWSHLLDEGSTMTLELSDYGKLVMNIINGLIGQGIVDTNRIYIAGSSMGGYSTYTFLAAYPDLFAAAAPMAGGLDLRTVDRWAGKVPIWIFHGSEDPAVSVEFSRRVVARLKENGVTDYRYSEYSGMAHGIWDRSFAEPDFLEWFFSHSKTGTKTTLR